MTNRAMPHGWLISATLGLLLLLPSGAAGSVPKVVLAEDFGATWCVDCPNARCALEIMLQEFGDQLIVAEHHMVDILDCDWTNARTDIYDVGPIPHVQFDGKVAVVGAGSCSGAAEAYRDAINQRLAETGGISSVDVSGHWWFDDEQVYLSATFALLDPATLVDTEAFLLVLEDDIAWQGTTYHHVTRAAYDEPITLSNVGDSVTVSAAFPIGLAWDVTQFDCIAFLQTMSGDHEIHQSAHLSPLEDFELTLTPAIRSLPDGFSMATLSGSVRNEGEATDQLTLSLDNQFDWHAAFRLGETGEFGTQPQVRSLAPGEELDVALRVFTDDVTRTGTGYLVTESANSGAVRATRARVFNGSPAILVVDDDHVDPTEEVITAALEERGYLHDLWSVYVQHLNQSPGLPRLQNYDAVIWHHGWACTNLLTTQEVANLTAYLDQGGRLLLSSQDYLSTTGSNDFTQNYLGLAHWDTDVGATELSGMPGDPIGDGMTLPLTYPGPEADRADALAPGGISWAVFENERAEPVAVRADNGTGRTVFLAFGINAVDEDAPDPNNAATVIDRSLQWLLSLEGTDVPPVVPAASPSRILSLRPTLLRDAGGVTIQLAIGPQAAGETVRLEVLDVAGRHVRTLCDRPVPAGWRTVSWDGRDGRGHRVGSGLYYARLRCGGSCDQARCVAIR
ncbi:MAG: hypothetical protein GF330_09040 [Candidatus Eisenbacteria bacterium]|nr:hypothetical protein [Candidatus Eisenbacteria bacterium]